MKTNWSKFKQLTVAEKLLLVQALALLPINAVCLQLFGFNRWQAVLTRTIAESGAQSPATQEQLVYAQTLGRIVNIAAAHTIHQATCLPRSMTLWWLLQRRKIASELRIGVCKDAAIIKAHAWIECRGVVINDRSDVSRDFIAFAERFDALNTRRCETTI